MSVTALREWRLVIARPGCGCALVSRRQTPPSFRTMPVARGRVAVAGGLIVVAALIAYRGSFAGPFIFDDVSAIAENPALHSLSSALSPAQGGLTTSGRPLLSLSFALNRALGGTAVWGYHAANLLIHALAGLTLFGIVRRTLGL